MWLELARKVRAWQDKAGLGKERFKFEPHKDEIYYDLVKPKTALSGRDGNGEEVRCRVRKGKVKNFELIKIRLGLAQQGLIRLGVVGQGKAKIDRNTRELEW